MTEEEFRAQMEGMDAAPAPAPARSAPRTPFKGGFKPAPAPAPRPAPPPPPPARTAAPAGRRPGGFSGATVPLVVRQSQKDGAFNLAGRLSFTIRVDGEAYEHVTTTGEGLDGKDATGQYVEGFKVGELTVWPPFNKRA